MARRTAGTPQVSGQGKRQRGSGSDDEPTNGPARKSARRGVFAEGKTTLQQARPYHILTAKMPVMALTTEWTTGKNRPIDETHVDELCQIFKQGGLKRDAEGNHLLVLCTRAEVQSMPQVQNARARAPDGEAMHDFGNWLSVNPKPVEVLAGQHRIEALKRYVHETDSSNGEKELWWPCEFYDIDTLPQTLNLRLRVNRRDPIMVDSHGDIWMQLVAAASRDPDMFHGNCDQIEAQMLDALELDRDAGFPKRRLVTIWRNKRWRAMTTEWCQTTVGRTTFQISTWDWMICFRIDDFWFTAFRQVMNTLAQLHGDAAKRITAADWKRLSDSLGTGRSEEQVRQLFYPKSQATGPTGASTERDRTLLRAFDDRAYKDVYDRIVQTPALRFPDIHRITGLSQGQGRVLFQVMDHVVDWLDTNRASIKDRRDNEKPSLREDLVAALTDFDPKRLRQAEKRLTLFVPLGAARSTAETASVLLQQEVLEFVLEHLAAFKAAGVKAYLPRAEAGVHGDGYAARFRESVWRGVLDIVRRYKGSDFRAEWVPPESGDNNNDDDDDDDDEEQSLGPSALATNLTDAFCNYAIGLPVVSKNRGVRRKIRSSTFRAALAAFFSQQCDDDGPEDDEQPSNEDEQSDTGARGSSARSPGETISAAAEIEAAAAEDRPTRQRTTAAQLDATRRREATGMGKGQPPTGLEERPARKATAQVAQGAPVTNTKAPAEKKQYGGPVLNVLPPDARRQASEAAAKDDNNNSQDSNREASSPVRAQYRDASRAALESNRNSLTPSRPWLNGPRAGRQQGQR